MKRNIAPKVRKVRKLNPVNLPGPESPLNEDLSVQIRNLVLKGHTYIHIQKKLNINANTWNGWVLRDYKGFRKNLQNWKNERLIKKATTNLEHILDIKEMDDKDLLRIKADVSKFVAERLDRENYSTRGEIEQKIISLSLSDLFDKANKPPGKEDDIKDV